MSKKIICEHCSASIKSKDDLVVANLFISLETYHNECYVQGLKTAKTFLLNNHPLNSTGATANAIYSLIIASIVFVFLDGEMRILAFIASIPFFLRIISYILYERHLA